MTDYSQIVKDALSRKQSEELRVRLQAIAKNEEDMQTWLTNFPKYKDWPVEARANGVFIVLPECEPIEVLAPFSQYTKYFKCGDWRGTDIDEAIQWANDRWKRDHRLPPVIGESE